MADFPALPLWTDAYLADTADLDACEHGCYLILLMISWRRHDCALPNDLKWMQRSLNAYCGGSIHGNRFNSIVPKLLERFFQLGPDGKFHQKRLRKERDFVLNFSRTQSEIAKKRWAKVRKDKELADAVAMPAGNAPTPTPTPIVREDANASLSETSSDTLANETPKRRKRVSYPPDFEAFWTAFPTDALMSKKAAGLVWSRMSEDVRQLAMASLAAFRAYCTSKPDYRPVHAVRYLTQERFVGFSEVVSKAAGKVFVAKGTPQWTAWQRVQHSSCVTSAEHRQDGWWFESEWPNGEHSDERKTA
jgi:uncharacterized protein YdaU (DUF1376 family)